MGNDGGSIPTRRELVKEAARNPTLSQLKETIKEQQGFLWSTCPLSHKRLAKPIVSDSAGNLYNKESILQYLLPDDTGALNKGDCERVLGGRVKALKDVVEVQFEVSFNTSSREERWVCPITSKELGPAVRSVYLVPCGHAFSAEAIKEMKGSSCLQCDTTYEDENIIPILPFAEDDMNRLKQRAERLTEQGLTHTLKKASGSSKKRKAKLESLVTDDKEAAKDMIKNSIATHQSQSSSNPPSGTLTPKNNGGIKNAATASLTAKVLQEEEERKKRRKMMGGNENLKSLFKTSDGSKQHKDGDFMTRGFSIPANAKR